MEHQWVAHERARIGLEVERGVLSASIVVQDARIAGFPSPLYVDEQRRSRRRLGSTPPTSKRARPSFTRRSYDSAARRSPGARGGSLGTSDWLLVPRSLDAVRARWVVRQLDVEAFAALLTAPASVPPEYARQATAPSTTGLTGTGVQLYGVNTALHLEPLLHVEVAGLARIARTPLPPTLMPSDTYVIDGRVFGERAGWSYAAEFAYELGRLAMVDRQPSIAAWGATAHVDWQTTWMLRPKLSLSGSYATGDDGSKPGTVARLRPHLARRPLRARPDGTLRVVEHPRRGFHRRRHATDEMRVSLGYRYVRLADPRGAWFAATLAPVGTEPAKTTRPSSGTSSTAQ